MSKAQRKHSQYMAAIDAGAIQRAAMENRAKICWSVMDSSERACVRMGMSPHWTALVDLDGHAGQLTFPALVGDEHRLLAVALMGIAKKDGRMIA